MRIAALVGAGVVSILAGGTVRAADPAPANGNTTIAAPADTPSAGAVRAYCRIEPRAMDVSVYPGPLTARIEIFSPDGVRPLDVSRIAPGVHLASVGGTRLPAPDGRQDGIAESPDSRSREDKTDVRHRGPGANQATELVVRFDRPGDGDPATIGDGDGGDVLAMLTDVPDGRTAEICLAGAFGDEGFTCCDTVTIRNRGLRDLPPGLRPTGSATRP